MMVGLLWIIGIYGVCIAILHAVYAWHRSKGRPPATTYFALITYNNETQIEWYLRSLLFFSWLRGRQVSIVLFDEGSTDGTLDVVRTFAEAYGPGQIRIMETDLDEFLNDHENEQVVLHRLKPLGKGEQLPVLQW